MMYPALQSPPPVYQGAVKAPPLHFYFYEDITEPVNYCELVYTLDHAEPKDEIHIHLATGGGDMESAIVIVHAIQRTQATVIGYADGGVASAGTIILLSCQHIVVSPFSHFLIHDGSLGTPRMKFSENLKQAKAVCELYEKLARSVYGNFFTEDEITRILDGSDCYVTSEQMAERLEIGFAKMEAIAEAEEQEQN